MTIQTKRYVDIDDLSEEAQEAYKKLVSEAGIGNGSHWGWQVGAKGHDSSGMGYISDEQCELIDTALRKLGLLGGDHIDLVFGW